MLKKLTKPQLIDKARFYQLCLHTVCKALAEQLSEPEERVLYCAVEACEEISRGITPKEWGRIEEDFEEIVNTPPKPSQSNNRLSTHQTLSNSGSPMHDLPHVLEQASKTLLGNGLGAGFCAVLKAMSTEHIIEIGAIIAINYDRLRPYPDDLATIRRTIETIKSWDDRTLS